jgi:hypothetical protein
LNQETLIQNEILDFLNRNGVFAFRINNGGVYDPTSGVYRNPGKFSLKGISDVAGVLPDGRALFVEVKTKTGKMSKEQKVFIAKINRCQAIGICANSVVQMYEQLKERGYDLRLDRESTDKAEMA